MMMMIFFSLVEQRGRLARLRPNQSSNFDERWVDNSSQTAWFVLLRPLPGELNHSLSLRMTPRPLTITHARC